MHAKNENGEHRFAMNECLSPEQIRSNFSRTAEKNKSLGEEEVVKDESVEEESAYYLLFICQLYGSKIILRHFCSYFNMAALNRCQIVVRYHTFLSNLVQSSTCNRC